MSSVSEDVSLSGEVALDGSKITGYTLQVLEKLERSEPGAVHPVIVHFQDRYNQASLDFMAHAELSQSNRESRHAIARAHAEHVQRGLRAYLWGGQVGECFRDSPHFQFQPDRMVRFLPLTNCAIVPATTRLVEAMRTRDNVFAIQRCLKTFPVPGEELASLGQVLLLADPGGTTGGQSGYTWGWHFLGLPHIHQNRRLFGDGVVLGMANTGVCEDHPDLVFKVKDFCKVEPSGRIAPAHSFDLNGHGTHCAGVMIGAANSGTQIGGAPAAVLKAVSIMDSEGTTTHGNLLQALEWLGDPYRSADVINLSVGIETPTPDEIKLLERQVTYLRNQGIMLVAAIGNQRHQSMYPARLDGVIGCGAITVNGDVWASSGTGPDFVLPGQAIHSALPPLNPRSNGQCYGWYTGTSMACAHMTALVALFMEAKPRLGLGRMVSAFRDTASNGGVWDARAGWGIPSLENALRSCGA
jgi:subtilisin